MRKFPTGATRSEVNDKLEYARFFSPEVLKRRAQYMAKHTVQEDGKKREPDNWKKGMPLQSYKDSAFRHFHDWWSGIDEEEGICALMFNCEGYLFELLKKK